MLRRGLLDVSFNFFQTLYKFRLYIWLLWGLVCTPHIKGFQGHFLC